MSFKLDVYYRNSTQSINFVPPGNCTIAKIVLFGDHLVLKSQSMTFRFSKSAFLYRPAIIGLTLPHFEFLGLYLDMFDQN